MTRAPMPVAGTLDGLPVVRAAFSRTVRLVTTARLRDAVLKALADSAGELADLAEIEGATSPRLLAEAGRVAAIDPRELVHGIPHAHFINAAFVYAKPRSLNRFNGPERGAWYAALTTETALAEVTFHMTAFLAEAGTYEATVEYAEMFASLAGEYVDLRKGREVSAGARGEAVHPLPLAALDPDPAVGYPAGNALAAKARAAGHYGIIYPSVRHRGGTCFAALIPHAVQSVAAGDVYRLRWRGAAAPEVARAM